MRAVVLERNPLVARKVVRYLAAAGVAATAVEDPAQLAWEGGARARRARRVVDGGAAEARAALRRGRDRPRARARGLRRGAERARARDDRAAVAAGGGGGRPGSRRPPTGARRRSP